MAWEIPTLCISYKAGADLSSKQYHFVKLSGGNVVACSAATDKAIGVLQNAPTANQNATVMSIGVTKVSGDAALAVADLIGPSADGQADAKVPGTDTTEYIHGQVLEGTTAANGLATALINCAAPARAA